jgi:hypothetical protein
MTGTAASLLLKRLVRYLHTRQFLADLDMALDTEIRHLLFEQIGNLSPVGIVTGTAGAILDRRVYHPRFLQGLGEIRVAFQTQIPDGRLEKGFFRGFVGIMTLGA